MTAPSPVAPTRDVVFSTTDWLAKRQLAEPRVAEIAGRTFAFRPSLTVVEAEKFDKLLGTPGGWPQALGALLVDAGQVDELVQVLPVPVAQRQLRAFLTDFVDAVCGDLGEAAAS